MRALHERARERGVRRVWLEVIVENTGAFALYEKLGYGLVQDVEVWTLPRRRGRARGGARFRPPRRRRSCPAARAVAARRRHPRPLQRRPRSRHRQRRDALLRALERAAPAVRRRAGAAAPGAAHLRRRLPAQSARRTTRRPRCCASSAPRSSSASTRCCSSSRLSTRLDRGADRACHAVRLVAAARHERARGRACARVARARPRGHRPGSLEPRPRPRCRTPCAARVLRRPAGADRARAGRADLPPQPDGRAGRSPREPLARARTRPVRRRPRLRAGAAEPVVPRAPRLGGAHRGDVLLARRLGYPPGRAQRERLLGRVDALLATSQEVAEAPQSVSPAATSSCRTGSTPSYSRPRRRSSSS